jgi:hypothetical protein
VIATGEHIDRELTEQVLAHQP